MSECTNLNLFQTKMVKIYTLFPTKKAGSKTIPSGTAHYIRVYPHPEGRNVDLPPFNRVAKRV